MSELERLRERSLSPTWSRTTTLPASRRMFSLGALEEVGGGERAEMLQAGGKGAAESSLVGFMAHTPKRIDEPPACKSTYGTSGAEEVPEASLANWKQSGMETEGEKGINTFCEHQDNAAMPRTCEEQQKFLSPRSADQSIHTWHTSFSPDDPVRGRNVVASSNDRSTNGGRHSDLAFRELSQDGNRWESFARSHYPRSFVNAHESGGLRLSAGTAVPHQGSFRSPLQPNVDSDKSAHSPAPVIKSPMTKLIQSDTCPDCKIVTRGAAFFAAQRNRESLGGEEECDDNYLNDFTGATPESWNAELKQATEALARDLAKASLALSSVCDNRKWQWNGEPPFCCLCASRRGIGKMSQLGCGACKERRAKFFKPAGWFNPQLCKHCNMTRSAHLGDAKSKYPSCPVPPQPPSLLLASSNVLSRPPLARSGSTEGPALPRSGSASNLVWGATS